MISLATTALIVGAFGFAAAILATIGNALALRDKYRLERELPADHRTNERTTA